MSVKEESTAVNSSSSFAEAFAETTAKDGDVWYVERQIPRLKSVRGRIILIDRVGSIGGIHWGDLVRQDQYRASLDVKARAVQEHFMQAVSGTDEQWFINFCSGVQAGRLVTPRQYAAQSNQATLEFLKKHTTASPRRLGMVVLDFPSEELIEVIVESNFATNAEQ